MEFVRFKFRIISKLSKNGLSLQQDKADVHTIVFYEEKLD